eukprot:scaffold157059_cov56-Cyclotella_meneghiniana.AAC.2
MIYKAASNLPIHASSIKIGDVLTTVNAPPPFQSGIAIGVDRIVASIYSKEAVFGGSDAGWFYLAVILRMKNVHKAAEEKDSVIFFCSCPPVVRIWMFTKKIHIDTKAKQE